MSTRTERIIISLIAADVAATVLSITVRGKAISSLLVALVSSAAFFLMIEPKFQPWTRLSIVVSSKVACVAVEALNLDPLRGIAFILCTLFCIALHVSELLLLSRLGRLFAAAVMSKPSLRTKPSSSPSPPHSVRSPALPESKEPVRVIPQPQPLPLPAAKNPSDVTPPKADLPPLAIEKVAAKTVEALGVAAAAEPPQQSPLSASSSSTPKKGVAALSRIFEKAVSQAKISQTRQEIDTAMQSALQEKNKEVLALNRRIAELTSEIRSRDSKVAALSVFAGGRLTKKPAEAAPSVHVRAGAQQSIGAAAAVHAHTGARSHAWAVLKAAALRASREGKSLVPNPLSAAEATSLLAGGRDSLTPERISSIRLALSQSDKKWMSEFLEQDGLFLLARAVKSFEEKEKLEMADVVCQTKLVTSIRAVANNKRGLDALIEANGGQVLRTLVGVISRSTNVMMRTQVVELMAATCIYSLRGHEVVLEALGEASGGEAIVAADGAMRFAVVAKWLREDSEATSKAAVVSLINSIISAPPAVEDRVKLRRLFTHLNVHESLEALKIEAADQREQELVSQIETFFHEMKSDANELRKLTTEFPVDLTNPDAVFRAVKLRLIGTPQEASFTEILRHLLLISPQGPEGAKIWEAIEKVILKVSSALVTKDSDKVSLEETTKILRDLAPRFKEVPTSTTAAPAEEPSASAPPLPPPPMPEGSAPPPPPPPMPGGPPPPPMPGSKGPQKKPAIKLRPLYWEKISPAVARSTIWNSRKLNAEALSLDTEELCVVFCAEPPKKEVAQRSEFTPNRLLPFVTSNSPEETKPKVVTLIETKRSNNIAIILSQFKKMSMVQLRDAIATAQDETIESLEGLTTCIPLPEEMEQLAAYEGDKALLGRSEQWLLCIGAVPSVQAKLDMLLFRRTFGMKVKDLQKAVAIYDQAVDEVTSNQKFDFILKCVLSIGNQLNAGTAKGNASGFKMESLSKLSELRSPVKSRCTLLTYLVEFLDRRQPEALEVIETFPNVQLAKTSQTLPDVISIVTKLAGHAEAMMADLEEKHNDHPDFIRAMKEFLRLAIVEGRTLVEHCVTVDQKLGAMLRAYGEEVADPADPKQVSTFFGHIDGFASSFKAAVKDLRERKEKEQKKKLSEAKAATAGKEKTKLTTSSGEGVVDALLSSIRGGNFKLRRTTKAPTV